MKFEKNIKKWSILIFLFWALFIAIPSWAFGSSSYVRIHDNADGRMAIRMAIRDDIENHEFGLWDPNIMGGLDRVTQGKSLDITNIIFYLLPNWIGYSVILWLQRFVAGYFSFQLLHKKLKIQPMLALFPAMFYALFPQNQINNQFDGFTLYDSIGLPAIPLMLFLVGYILEKERLKIHHKTLLLFLSGILFASISHFAFTIFFFPLLLSWIFITSEKNWKTNLWAFVVFFLGWIAIENFEIMASTQVAPLSHRSLRNTCELFAHAFDVDLKRQLASQLQNTVQFPLFVVGTIGSFLTLSNKNQKKYLLFLPLLVIFIIGNLYAKPIACYLEIPFLAPIISILKGFNLSRFNLYMPFLIVVIFAIATQSFITLLSESAPDKYRKHFQTLPILAISLISIVWGINQAIYVARIQETRRLQGANFANLFENPYLEHLAQITKNDEFPYRAVMLSDYNNNIEHVYEQPTYMVAYGINILDGYTALYPINYWLYWNRILDPLEQQYPDCRYVMKFQDAYNRAYLSNHCELSETLQISDPAKYYNINLLSIAGVKYFVSTNPLESDSLTEIDTSTISCPNIPNCYRYYLYENKNAFPFLFTQHSVIMRPDEFKTLNQLGQLDFEILQNNIILDKSQQHIPITKLAEGIIEFSMEVQPGYVLKINYSSETDQILIINSTYNEEWVAEIDGQAVPTFPAYHLLTGIYIPPGNHTVKLVYYPDYLFSRIFNNTLRFFYP